MRVALVQMNSGSDAEQNLATIEARVAEGAARGARLVALPENATLLARPVDRVARAEALDGPTVARLGRLARRHGVWISLAGFPERTDDPARTANASLLLGPDGALAAVYRKIHLFDLSLPELTLCESATTRPGDALVVHPIDGVPVGLSICYDLRFPELYRALVRAGARVLLVPSAFTVPTGKAHWEVLLRARAIENQAYVVAAAQCGAHPGSERVSFGHGLAVDPWGRVLVDQGESPGLDVVDLDQDAQDAVRRGLPALEHARPPERYLDRS
ncbi:MAG: carbon-nitrogen hydrolase family protein [Myxococcales bacterium]|nr:carbon-nitrogen hydrolase family protein [Myxococcales bacterium]